MERLRNYKTLAHPEIDKKRGFTEIVESPIYKNYVISEDGKTSGIVIYLKKDEKLNDFIRVKQEYFDEFKKRKPNQNEKEKYKIFLKDYEEYKNLYNKRNHQNISEIRSLIGKYGDNANIHLGGIPMIADDMMSFIKNDILVFGAAVFIFILFTLWMIFKNIKWVIMPLIGCTVSVILMVGFLGFVGWKVTVISSNFIALMLILNMAMNIHLTVRFLQLKKDLTSISKDDVIVETSKRMFLPILYTVLTTISAFLSLIYSGIKTIIDLGWIMTIGLLISMTVTFFLLPCLLNILTSEDEINLKDTTKSMITSYLSSFTKNNTVIIFIITILILVFSVEE